MLNVFDIQSVIDVMSTLKEHVNSGIENCEFFEQYIKVSFIDGKYIHIGKNGNICFASWDRRGALGNVPQKIPISLMLAIEKVDKNAYLTIVRDSCNGHNR